MAFIDGARVRVLERMRLTDRRLNRRLAILNGPTRPDGGLITAIGHEFARGFNDTLHTYDPAAVTADLNARDDDYFAPFYAEGAAMAFAAGRALHPRTGDDVHRELITALPGHRYLIFAGWGWWYCVRPFGGAAIRRSTLWRHDSLFAGLGVDGMAFATCFLKAEPPHFDVPCPFPDPALQSLWLQGHGRALWFVSAAHPHALTRQYGRLDPGRRPELHAGLGLATAFAGMRDLRALPAAPGHDETEQRAFYQGLAFGLTARREASPRTYQRFLNRLDGPGAAWVAAVTDQCLKPPEPVATSIDGGYVAWQRRFRAELVLPEGTS